MSAAPGLPGGEVGKPPARRASPARGAAVRASRAGATRRYRTATEMLAATMMENRGPDSLEGWLRAALKKLPQLKVQHNGDSRRAHPDWPDWVIGGPHGVLFRELKREGRKPTRGQQAWLDLLAATGHDAGVWRPSDRLSGRIGRELAKIAYGAPAVIHRSRRALVHVPADHGNMGGAHFSAGHLEADPKHAEGPPSHRGAATTTEIGPGPGRPIGPQIPYQGTR